MSSQRNQLLRFLDQEAIPDDKVQQALVLAAIPPGAGAWRRFIDLLLLVCGVLALAFAVMFFIAHNWGEMGRYAKFALIEILLLLSVLAYWKLGAQSAPAQVSLLAATLLLGVLLALYGQTYQTGADTWELFLYWALLMLPWALIGRFAAIWIVWLALLNLAIVLYFQTFRGILWMALNSGSGAFWVLFGFNMLALAVWEFCATRMPWLAQRWAPRLVAVAGGTPITLLALYAIFDWGDRSLNAGLIWPLWLAAMFAVYLKFKHDLFMLAGACLSAIVVIIVFAARHLIEAGSAAGIYLLLAFLSIGMGTAAAIWLRHVHRAWQT